MKINREKVTSNSAFSSLRAKRSNLLLGLLRRQRTIEKAPRNDVLILIVALGLALRLWGIDFGLPFHYHQDEPIVVNHALAYGTGDLNPHFFIIPPLTSYILFFFYGAYFLLLNAFGAVSGTEAFAVSFFKDPTPFYLIGRLVIGFLPSIYSVYLTYKLTLKFYSKKAALYACWAMAAAFLNAVNAHYLYTDNLLVMFVLLACLAMADLMERPLRPNYILSAVFIGLAIATKYNAAVLIGPFLLAHLFSGKRSKKNIIFNPNLLTFAAVTVLTFIICNPYSVLDWRFFLNSVTGKIRHGYIGWSHHIFYSMFEGFGSIQSILGLAGLGLALMNSFRKTIFIISFPVIFYIHLVFISQPFSRYALPLLPFFSIGLGFLFFDHIYPRLKGQALRAVMVAVSIIIIMPGVAKSIKADMLFAAKDTRTEAAEWIKENIAPSARIALDSTFFSPPLNQTVAQLREKEHILGKQPELQGLKGRKLKYQIKALVGQDENSYQFYYLIEGHEDIGQFLGFWPVIESNIAALKRERIEYLIFNNMSMAKGIEKLRRAVAERYKPIAIFNPYQDKEFRGPYDEVATTCIPVKGRELFSRQKPGPYIIIYRLR